MNARYRLVINPADSEDTQVVRDDNNGTDLLVVLSEQVDYNLKRARDYHETAEQGIVRIKQELERRRRRRGKSGNR